MKLSNEFKIGFIVTVALALLYWGVNFLKGKDVFSSERIFVAIYNDVAGLEKTNPITINGLTVGQVRNMTFSNDGEARVMIELVLKNKIDIPANSTAKIVSSDLLGSKAVEITLGDSPELALPGDTLTPDVEASIKDEVNRQLQPLKVKAESLMGSIDTVLSMLQSVFSDDNTDNFAKSVKSIANSFENLENTTGTLDTLITDQKSRMEKIFANIESITLNLKNNEGELNNIIANFSTVSDTLAKIKFAQTMQRVDKTLAELAEISGKINNGEGSLGMLVNNDSLYIELEETSRNLHLLLEDIRLRADFEVYLKKFLMSLDVVLPNPAADSFRVPAKRFGYLFHPLLLFRLLTKQVLDHGWVTGEIQVHVHPNRTVAKIVEPGFDQGGTVDPVLNFILVAFRISNHPHIVDNSTVDLHGCHAFDRCQQFFLDHLRIHSESQEDLHRDQGLSFNTVH